MKPISAATQAMLDEMEEQDAVVVSKDKLIEARELVGTLLDHETEAGQIEEQLGDVKRIIKELKEHTIPNFFDEVGIPGITLEAKGNMPPFEIKIGDRYYANIPTETEEEAFDYLTQTGNADLIKTIFTISFGRNEAAATERFARSLDNAGIPYTAKRGVPWNTLSAWLREEHRRKPIPSRALEILGASIGRVAKIVKTKRAK